MIRSETLRAPAAQKIRTLCSPWGRDLGVCPSARPSRIGIDLDGCYTGLLQMEQRSILATLQYELVGDDRWKQ